MSDRICFLCIDHRLEEDLLFWQTLARNIAASPSRPPMFLVVGSGERAEQLLAGCGGSVHRSRGTLQPESRLEQESIERAAREEGHRIVQVFADSGLSSVGFTGVDRKILIRKKSGHLSVSQMASLTAWCRSGVIPVLMCVGLDTDNKIVDFHPSEVCQAILETEISSDVNMMGQMVLLVSKASKTLMKLVDTGAEIDSESLLKESPDMAPILAILTAREAVECRITHVSQVAEMRAARLRFHPGRR